MRKIIFVDGAHNVLFLAATIGFVFLAFSFIEHWLADFDFSVLKVDKVCEVPLNNRCENHYLIKGKSGRIETIVPSGYKFRSDDFEIGNHLMKNKFEIGYQVNGVIVEWTYLRFHLVGMLLCVIAFIWWQFLTREISR